MIFLMLSFVLFGCWSHHQGDVASVAVCKREAIRKVPSCDGTRTGEEFYVGNNKCVMFEETYCAEYEYK